ncbi:MAG: hypothetical protein PHV05_00205 [Candidatus Riflebacteria bacterium]|nr:hypothetical protein [Candidatus Riflebacteria bacterium]
MRNLAVIAAFFVLCIFIGCLGVGSGGGTGTGGGGSVIVSGAVLGGRVYFADRSYYGGIPITAKNAAGLVMDSTRTDAYGNFYFSSLPPGVYNIFANTGESEIQFFTGAQVVVNPLTLPDKPLVDLENVILDHVTSSSVRLRFTASVPSVAQVEYGTAAGVNQTVTTGSVYSEDHVLTISNLTSGSRYGFTIRLQTQDGQVLVYSSLYTTTTPAVGPFKTGFAINNGEIQTRFSYVNLYFWADNAVQMRVGTSEDLDAVAWETFTSIKDYTFSSGDGTRRLYVQFRDAFGNVSSVINDSIQLQSDSAGYIGVWVNNGEALTNKTDAILTLLSPGATHMQVSDRSDFFSSFWEPFINTRKYTLSSGDGQKTVYVRFKGGLADPDKFFSSSIMLDTTGPGVVISINGGATKTNDRKLLLSFSVDKLPSEMQLSEDITFETGGSWVKYANPYSFTVARGEGEKTVYARFKDSLGNISSVVEGRIILDTKPPQNVSLLVNDGDAQTDTLAVKLTMTADADDGESILMMISNVSDFSGAVLERFNGSKAWTLGGYGIQSVYVYFVDDASNTSNVLVGNIEVVGDPPSSGSVLINDGDPTSDYNDVSLTVFSDSAKKVRISQNQNFNSADNIDYIANLADGSMRISSYLLSPTAGAKMVYARFEDASGSFSISSDSITLIGPENYTLTTQDDQPLATYTVNLRPFANNAAQMILTEDYADFSDEAKWVPFAYSVNLLLKPFNGKHTVYAKYRNVGKVETPAMSLDVTVTGVIEVSPSIIINSGDSITERSSVTVSVLTTPSYPIMRLSNDGDFFSAADTAAVNQPWLISRSAGSKTVYARFQNSSNGEFFTAQDSITARGPASPTISTRDSQPLNNTVVNLELFAGGAADMLLTQNPDVANLTTGWVPYQTSYVFSLENKTGPQTVFAKFRNTTSNWIETVPVQLDVTVNNTSPTGNVASFRETAAPASPVTADLPVASLPVYLHFNIQDPLTTTVFYQLASSGASVPTVFKSSSVPVAPVVLNTGDFPGNGTFNLYYQFSDGVGNKSSLAVTSIRIRGPSLKISPATAGPLYSGQTQQFAANLENVEGTVRWSISPSGDPDKYGTINSNTGLYTAPATVKEEVEFNILAELTQDTSVRDSATISLKSQVEIAVEGSKSQKISVGNNTTVTVRFRNSSLTGTASVSGTGQGSVSLSDHPGIAVPATDKLASLTYYAPLVVPTSANPVAVEVVSAQDPSKKEILYFEINDGPFVTMFPETTTMRVRDGSAVFTVETSSKTAPLNWSWVPAQGGYFDAARTETTKITTTTDGRHSITVYATSTVGLKPQLIAGFIEEGRYYGATATITLGPSVQIAVTPRNQKLYLGDTTGISFHADVTNATTTAVTWQFKNASDTVWINADNYDNETNGTLILNGQDAVYMPPSAFPEGVIKIINIRAISEDDGTASASTNIELLEALRVEIYDGFNANGTEVTGGEVSVTLEVGTRQFFAAVGPVTESTTNTTVKWYVQNVAGGNTTYGTVDETGKYTAPDTAPQAAVTLKAVSNFRTTAFAETTINLLDFWEPRSDGLDNVTNATHSIYSIQIDPTRAAATNRILYTGTNGYGLYRSTIAPDGLSYNWDSVPWTGVTGLSTQLVGQGGSYVINDISISLQHPDRLVVATNDGLYLVTADGTTVSEITIPNPRNAPTGAGAVSTTYSSDFTRVFSGVKIDPSDDTYMYALGKDQGVVRFTWSGGTYVYNGTLYDDDQRYSVVTYSEWPWNQNTGSVATPTWVTGSLSRPQQSYLASNTMEFQCIEMNSQNPNVVYVGFTKFLSSRSPDVFKRGYLKLTNVRTAEYLYISQDSFDVKGSPIPLPGVPHVNAYPAGNPETLSNWHYIGPTGMYNWDDSGIIHALAVDPNTPSTIWKAKDSGVFRSTDDGETFAQSGNYTNVRDIFIDPINTVNVYIGTETGLYRTRNAGSTWKQIKSGLEGHTTINALGLTPGGVGTRRIFCGTTNGIFMGRTTLDLE